MHVCTSSHTSLYHVYAPACTHTNRVVCSLTLTLIAIALVPTTTRSPSTAPMPVSTETTRGMDPCALMTTKVHTYVVTIYLIQYSGKFIKGSDFCTFHR